MTETPLLRAACEHGRYEAHGDWHDGIRSWPGCPGGREVTMIELGRWDTQDSLTFDWQPGLNGSLIVAIGAAVRVTSD